MILLAKPPSSRSARWISTFLTTSLLALQLPIAPALAATTLTLQQGATNYTGTTDLFITNQYAQWTGGNGRAETKGNLPVYRLSGTNGYETRSFIRFNTTSIPAGAVVKDAKLTLTFNNWSTNFTIQGDIVKTSWNPTFTGLGWLKKDATSNWASPGANGMGTDLVSGSSFTIGGFAGTGKEIKTISLPLSAVQQWITSDGTSNFGIRFLNLNADKTTQIYSSEASTIANRPKLTIVYELGSTPPPPPPPTPSIPSAPTNLTVSNITTSSASLKWTDTSSNETQFLIERKTGLNGSFTQIGNTGTNTITYPANGMTANTLYVFRVRASNDAGTSAYSNELQVTTSNNSQPPPPPPSDTIAPTVTLTTPSGGSTVSGTVTLSANATDNIGVTGVKFIASQSNTANQIGGEDVTSPYSTSWNTTTVPNGTYTLIATARDAANNFSSSPAVTVTVQNGVTPPPPPPPPAGTPTEVNVTLVPHAEVVGNPTTVSFGLPLPPGTLADPANIVVLDPAGQEIPAYVKSLGPWRSMPPTSVLCSGVNAANAPGIRSALVQFQRTFPNTTPVTVKIKLNQARTKHVSTEIPISQTVRLVKEGTYTAQDNITEPKVYALLPQNWLACSNLTTLASISGKHPGLSVFDAGQKNFFPTVINQFNSSWQDPNYLTKYKTDYEPWLYDRGQVFYNAYIRTGELHYLREAHRATKHYMSQLYKSGECPGIPDQWCKGFFKLKQAPTYYYKDSKYSYAESAATLYWLTGDPEAPARIADVVSATQTEVPLTQSPVPSYFTERHWGFALMAPIIGYEVTGNAAWADYAKKGIDALSTMQSSPIEGKPPTGCFTSHVEDAAELSFSPWMSSLLAHSLLRGYHSLSDTRVPGMLTSLAQCEVDRGIYFPTENGAPQKWMPRYIATSYGTPKSLDGDPWTDFEHAIDVAYVTALGAYFTPNTTQKTNLTSWTNKLLDTHTHALNYWTRPTGYPANGWPLYRVNPPRKYGWWYKNTGGIGWALFGPTALTN